MFKRAILKPLKFIWGPFNYYIITEYAQNLDSPSRLVCTCTVLVAPSPERSKLNLKTPCPSFTTTHHKNSKFCDFIVLQPLVIHPNTNCINYLGWFANFASNINQI